ncbi:hypothetical protein [Deinococcus sp.]|nr:hypothetical protein [Deinococcus sp.]
MPPFPFLLLTFAVAGALGSGLLYRVAVGAGQGAAQKASARPGLPA